jgi:hypothetical protein
MLRDKRYRILLALLLILNGGALAGDLAASNRDSSSANRPQVI